MNILVIIGSSKDGNTTEIVKYFEKKLRQKGNIDFKYLYLDDYKVDFCIGCHNCIFIGENKCPHYEKMKSIEEKMLSAQGVVFASPGYMFSMTGIMKNFFDHIAYNCHRPKYFGKKFYLLSACTKWQEKTVFAPMETWIAGAGGKVVGKTYIEMLPFPLKEKELDKRRNKLNISAKKFYKELMNQKEITPDFSGIIVFHVFRTLCKIAPKIFSADFRYFNHKNAYDKKTKWYIPVKIPFIKHKFAKAMENKIKKDVIEMIDVDKLKGQNGGYKNKL